MSFDFDFTVEQVRELVPRALGGPDDWYESMCEALPQYNINTVPRVASFIAQCAHESGGFSMLEENLNYKAATLTRIWPQRYPAGIAEQYAGKPELIANKSYGGRMGNGPESSGDGWKFRGRGALQLTGKANYEAFAKYLGNDEVLKNPDTVATKYAFESAMFFFERNKLWTICDKGINDAAILELTKRINGGTHGLEDRNAKTKKYYEYVK